MMPLDPASAVQKAVRARLIGTPAVVSLVPTASILDTNQRPAPSPSIILGEDQVVDAGSMVDRSVVRVHSTIHVWRKETSLEGVKAIAGAIWKAVKAPRLLLDTGFECADCRVIDTRFMRDSDGEHSHGIVAIETIVREVP